ncbi:MAG: CGCGG family rSAM-modified RiPP protein [Salinirussus sp.]
MSQSHGEHAHNHDADPVTDRVHDTSWSANLEKPEHADDESLVQQQAVEAVKHTTSGNHVNLVTHANHDHPETFLFEVLANEFEDAIDIEYVEQCGCGGHVTRVTVL